MKVDPVSLSKGPLKLGREWDSLHWNPYDTSSLKDQEGEAKLDEGSNVCVCAWGAGGWPCSLSCFEPPPYCLFAPNNPKPHFYATDNTVYKPQQIYYSISSAIS